MTAAHEIRVEHSRKRVRILLAGELVADTTRPLLVWEVPYYPTYFVPDSDVTAELFTVKVTSGAAAVGAARRYPASPARQLHDAVRFEWNAMGEWLEEDEPVYTHARDPHTRVDILASSRHVEVKLDGVTVADSTSPRILFETGLPPRYYLPLSDIRTDLLRSSDTESHCPYKGTATYWSVDTGTDVHKDVVWIYRTPLPESQKVAGLAAFYDEKVDVFIDGVEQRKPQTKWS